MDNKVIELAKKNGTAARLYPLLVEEKLAQAYPIGAQISLIRQKDEKPEEYKVFFEYAEQCKREAKAELGI